MKIDYDSKYDLMNIEFLPGEPIVDSLEINGVVIDYGKDGKIVSIEIIDASERTQKGPLGKLDCNSSGGRYANLPVFQAGNALLGIFYSSKPCVRSTREKPEGFPCLRRFFWHGQLRCTSQ